MGALAMKAHKHSHQHQLPAGCHDANTAAELMGISKKALLKRMRELGWLIVGGDAHNLPRREYVQMGLMYTQERGYALKGHQDISKSYRVMLLTQRGFQELKRVIDPNTNDDSQDSAPESQGQPTGADTGALQGEAKRKPTMAPHEASRPAHELPTPNHRMTEGERQASERERNKVMEELRQMGIAS